MKLVSSYLKAMALLFMIFVSLVGANLVLLLSFLFPAFGQFIKRQVL